MYVCVVVCGSRMTSFIDKYEEFFQGQVCVCLQVCMCVCMRVCVWGVRVCLSTDAWQCPCLHVCVEVGGEGVGG